MTVDCEPAVPAVIQSTGGIAASASRLRVWQRCRRRWFYEYVARLGKSAGGEVSGDLLFGSAVHASLEEWDRAVLVREPVDTALARILESLWEASRDWDLHSELCSGEKSRRSLLRIPVWYAEQFGVEDDPVQPLGMGGQALVEVPFSADCRAVAASLGLAGLDFGEWPEPPCLTGRFDSIVVVPATTEVWVRERKTTKSTISPFYIARYHPEIQTSLYPIIARWLFPGLDIAGVLLEAIQVGANFCRIERVELRRHPDQLRESLVAIAGAFREMAAHKVWRDEQPEAAFLLNEAACMDGGRPCAFRPLCLARPASRPEMIAEMFGTRGPRESLDSSSNFNTLTEPVEIA